MLDIFYNKPHNYNKSFIGSLKKNKHGHTHCLNKSGTRSTNKIFDRNPVAKVVNFKFKADILQIRDPAAATKFTIHPVTGRAITCLDTLKIPQHSGNGNVCGCEGGSLVFITSIS